MVRLSFVAIIFLLIDAISLNSSSSKKERQSVVCSLLKYAITFQIFIYFYL